MAQAPDGNDTLTPDDAAKILEELLDAQNHAKLLGLMLNVKPRDVEAIINRYKDPKEQLLHIIISFLQQAELTPTWRAIVDALRSSVVGLTALANKVESNHIPSATASRGAIADTVDKKTTIEGEDEVKSKKSTCNKKLCVSSASEDIKERITELEEMFHKLKKTIRDCLEKKKIVVKEVADTLTSISADEDEQHKLFLKSNTSILFRAADVPELFGTMNSHWNYLHPPLLEHLVMRFKLEEVKAEMESYKSELQKFQEQTPLTVFCSTQKKRRLKPTAEFREMVAEFDWPKDETLMLEIVEQFRQEYASHCNLRDCATMVAQIRPGSFIITWIIPESIVKVLRGKPARAVMDKFSVTRLDIDGVCVYWQRKPLEDIPGSSSVAKEEVYSTTKINAASSRSMSLAEEDYPHVVQPSEDFFCPVTMGLLVQPHLTSCCGNHLSEKAAERIQGEGGMCPLCKEKHWSTVLDKRFQRQVNSLEMFCRHEERGCGWQGELTSYQSHVKSCPFARGPSLTEPVKLPVCSVKRTSGKIFSRPSCETTYSTKAQLTVKCNINGSAPAIIRRGSAASDGQFAYFTPLNSNEIYQFEYNTEEWKRHFRCPYYNSGLAIINGQLTTVGGGNYTYPTNKLMMLHGGEWVEKYPPMKIERSHPAVVTTQDGTYYIVIGGELSGYGLEFNCSDTIEVFNGKERKWHMARKLPTPLKYPSATISRNQLYIIGQRGANSVGYSCSLQTVTLDGMSSLYILLPWNPLPPLPVEYSTPATICGKLVLVGGRDTVTVYSIYQLIRHEWAEIGCMNVARCDCFVVHPSPDKIIIVGGFGDETSVVEECNFS